MKRFSTYLIATAALALVSTIADSASAAVRRVYVRPYSRVYAVNPVPLYRPSFVITQPVRPMIYSPWNYNSAVIIHRGNHLHVVPAPRPVGAWGSNSY